MQRKSPPVPQRKLPLILKSCDAFYCDAEFVVFDSVCCGLTFYKYCKYVKSLVCCFKEQAPVYHPTPSVSGNRASRLTEEEQIRIAKRLGLIQHIPSGTYDGSKKARE